MRRALLLGVALLVWPAWARAQIDPRTDGIGCYFDQQAVGNCITTTSSFQLVTAYMIATRISATSGMSGFECAAIISGGGFCPLGWNVFHAGTNFLTAPLVAVGFGVLTVRSPAFLLASVAGYVESPVSQILLYIDALPTPTLPQYPHNPVYAPNADPFELRPLWQSTGGYDVPVAAINGDCPVANATGTWGGVQALYR